MRHRITPAARTTTGAALTYEGDTVKLSRTPVVVVAGAATASLLIGGVAYASSTSSTAAPGATAKQAQGHRGHHHRVGLGARAEHGEFTVHSKKADRVLDVQRGQVTAVTPASTGTAGTVTLKSRDGFLVTYAYTATSHVRNNGSRAAGSTVKVGELARVLAVKSGGTRSVLRLAAHAPKAATAGSTTTS